MLGVGVVLVCSCNMLCTFSSNLNISTLVSRVSVSLCVPSPSGCQKTKMFAVAAHDVVVLEIVNIHMHKRNVEVYQDRPLQAAKPKMVVLLQSRVKPTRAIVLHDSTTQGDLDTLQQKTLQHTNRTWASFGAALTPKS